MKKKVLIVDDEADMVKILSARLKSRDFDVEAFTDSTQALSAIQANLPDLVILDIMMPEMSGSEIAEHLKHNKATARIPIIFLSGLQTKDEEITTGPHIEGAVIFAKPYNIDELAAKIREMTA